MRLVYARGCAGVADEFLSPLKRRRILPLGAPPTPWPRAALLAGLRSQNRFDLAVIGGGATGLGVALDASARGLKVALFESGDFAQATSSRSTKLVHGGVRYLAQGHIALVREALAERGNLLANAPHLAQPLPFIVPAYHWWQRAYYGLGLAAYRCLAGRQSLGATRLLTPPEVLGLLPGVRRQGLRGGVLYWDAQFDDARLAIALARSAAARGARGPAPVVYPPITPRGRALAPRLGVRAPAYTDAA